MELILGWKASTSTFGTINLPRCYSSQSSRKSLCVEETSVEVTKIANLRILMDTMTHLESDLGTYDEHVLIRLSVAQRCVQL